MYEIKTHPVPETIKASAHIDKEKYETWYAQSIKDPDTFWAQRAKELITWFKPWKQVREYDFSKAEAKWFDGARLNASYNCIDRHLEKRGEQVAIIWEADDGQSEKIT